MKIPLAVPIFVAAIAVASLNFTIAGAQTPAPAPVALTDLETAYVQVVALAGQLADCEANKLPSVTQAQNVRVDALTRIQKAHPGYTIDWNTGKLVPLPPPAAPTAPGTPGR